MKIRNKISEKRGFAFQIAAAILFVFVSSAVTAQQNFAVDASSSMTVNGTSSIHDWESQVTKLNGNAQIAFNGSQIAAIDKLYINIPVTSIKSGKSGMDNNTYEALKQKKHPEIQFQLKEIKEQQNGKVKALGNLTIAGVTKSIELPVSYTVTTDSKVKFKGSVSFKMTDFKIDPPTALMGTIKTGDEVTLNFETVFVKR